MFIALFKSVIIFCRTDNIPRSIPGYLPHSDFVLGIF